MDDNLTPRQRQAVLETGQNVLVSASAGSGKTHVMIERIINLIINEGVNVENVLAVTYTKLAASEMKQKLVKAVIKRINEGLDVERMKKTLLEIPTADVSTFHSFCFHLLTTYFYAAGVDPDFSIGEEPETLKLSKQAIDSVFATLYEEKDEDFLYLSRIFRTHRRDDSVKEVILDLYSTAVSEANPDEFIDKCSSSVCDKYYSEYEEYFLKEFKFRLSQYKNKFDELAVSLSPYSSEKAKKLDLALKELFVKYQNCLSALDLQRFRVAVLSPLNKFPTVNESDDEYGVRTEIYEFFNLLKDIFKKFSTLIPEDRTADIDKFLSTGILVGTICKTCKLYGQKYTELKRKEGIVDYSDLEHLTYSLLLNNPSVLAEIREKYTYIFADEYQDVNGVQEAILNLISNGNLFMVGDVKQSIYAFRGCNPDIFAKKYKLYEKGDGGVAIPLDKNFRSSTGVLKAVNNIFSRIFTEEFSGADYSKNQMVFGELFPKDFGYAYLHVIDQENADNEPIDGLYDLVKHAETPNGDEAFYEGELIKKIILDEVSGKEIYDVKERTYRPAKFSDVAVILRNSKGFAEEVVNCLIRGNIPVSSNDGKAIESYPEIKLLTNFLRLLIYYADDAPLASVLKSAIGGLSDNDLAKIREFAISQNEKNRKKPFSYCLDLYEKEGPDKYIVNSVKSFKEYFNKIRLLSEFSSAGEILSKVIQEKNLDVWLATKQNGETRLKRIERFIAESESGGKKLSASEFLSRLETSKEITSANASGENAVTVVSMHGSKGLEYPIVIVAGIHKEFNAIDDKKRVFLSRQDGMSVVAFDEKEKRYSRSLSNAYFVDKAKRQRAKEEARVFYVALTRAQSKLHVVSSVDISNELTSESAFYATHFKDFICVKDFEKTFRYSLDDLNGFIAKDAETCEPALEDGKLVEKIVENLNFKYSNAVDTTLPVKDAVSAISSKQRKSAIPYLKTAENATEQIDKAKVGTLYHRFLEYCDFKEKNANNQLIRLLSDGIFTKEEVELLDGNRLDGILNLPIFDELSDYKLYREQQFITSFSARELYSEDSAAEILVQGIIDLLAVKGDEAVIVDYKVSDHSDERLYEEYSKQLELYKMAVQKCLNLKVTKTLILNLKST